MYTIQPDLTDELQPRFDIDGYGGEIIIGKDGYDDKLNVCHKQLILRQRAKVFVVPDVEY